ncbi:MAG: NAD(P)/FAD-dependent oxidoreductase [Pyrinomonadaceae bacterium]
MLIGGGPAGLSALLWCSRLGLDALLLERGKELGGQLLSIFAPITDHLGVSAASGRELGERFVDGLGPLAAKARSSAGVRELDADALAVTLDNGERISARAIVIATGVRRRELGVPGEKDFAGRGILRSGALERESVRGLRVAIVGGGDAAIENAIILSETAASVTVIHRGAALGARPEFQQEARRRSNVQFLMSTVVERFGGGERLESLDVSSDDGRERLEIDAALVRIGVVPNSEFLRSAVMLDDRGYVKIDAECRTSCERIFAVGDVARPTAPTISAAVGDGSIAAKSICLLING